MLTMFLTGCRPHSFYSYELVKSDCKEFRLDEWTTPNSFSTRFFSNESGDYYIHYNKNTNVVYYYDFWSCQLLGWIDFSGNYPRPYNLFFHSFDTIVFFYSLPKNYIVISDSSKVEKYFKNSGATLNFKEQRSVIDGSNTRPILFRGRHLFYSTLLLTEYQKDDDFICALGGSIDLDSLSRNNFIYYPEIYNKHNWGLVYHRMQSHCFDEEYMLVSFPASDYIYRYSLKDLQIDSILAKSELTGRIRPYRKGRIAQFDLGKTIRYYLKSPAYSSIYFDPYKNLYYRFVEHGRKGPITDYSFLLKELSVIILDKEMKRIGESYIGSDYYSNNCMVTRDGLYIRFHNKDEDKIVYHKFELKKI